MPLALVTGAARADSIAAGIGPRLVADGWQVATSDLHGADYDCDLADADASGQLVERVTSDHGPITALVLSHAHDVLSGVLDTTAESFDQHVAVNARASLLLIAAFARQVPDGVDPSSPSPATRRRATRPTAPPRAPSTASSSRPPASSDPSASRRTSSTRARSTPAGWTTSCAAAS